MPHAVQLTGDEITLGQFLKFADIVDSGGAVRWFLSEHEIHVNGEVDQRRGRKLHPGDIIEIIGIGTYTLYKKE